MRGRMEKALFPPFFRHERQRAYSDNFCTQIFGFTNKNALYSVKVAECVGNLYEIVKKITIKIPLCKNLPKNFVNHLSNFVAMVDLPAKPLNSKAMLRIIYKGQKTIQV